MTDESMSLSDRPERPSFPEWEDAIAYLEAVEDERDDLRVEFDEATQALATELADERTLTNRLRAENEALKNSWEIDAQHRDDLLAAVQAAYRALTNCDPDAHDNWKWIYGARETLAGVLNDDSGASDDMLAQCEEE